MRIFNHIFLLLTILVVFSAVVAEVVHHICRVPPLPPDVAEQIRKWGQKLKIKSGH
ncbi:unnamed protein product [Cylicocyclus nassatus]|uniref:Uncharacterized protein n=1 Tax=Cylicocyclus nassatus TaxID=53992 RepID=A0AA36HAF3_CYLNA|nr:unnamed protein product [Cylicocyclus nassatus]